MPSRSRDPRFLIAALAVVVVAYFGIRYLRSRPAEVNTHNPAVNRIDTFELQPGEVGVTVRVRFGSQPANAVTVWAEPQWTDDDEDAGESLRKGETNNAGLVRVPVRKDVAGSTRLFARDADGRLGGGRLSGGQLLSAPDIVLAPIAPRAGRLLTTDGSPIAGAALTAQSFSPSRQEGEVEYGFIDIPKEVQPEYRAQTDNEGRFSLPWVPVGYNCRLAFRTIGYGEGHLWLPAGSTGECRLARAGTVRLRVTGDGSAANLSQLGCRLNPANPPGEDLAQLHVDGYRYRRHDGTEGFVIPNVVPGDYRVQVEATAQNPVMPDRTVAVTVAPGSTAEVVLPLQRAGRLLGRVADAESGAGLKGTRLSVFASGLDGNDRGFSDTITTDGSGGFAAYVPAGVPVQLYPHKCPPGYASPQGRRAFLKGELPAVTAASGESRTLPDIKLHRQAAIAGTVVASGRPVADAVVEIRWDTQQDHKPVSVRTDAAGRFRVPNAPLDQPAAIRVRSAAMVNATVAFRPEELAGALTIPVSAENAYRVRGSVTDGSGRPLQRAKVVIVLTGVRSPAAALPSAKPGEDPANAPADAPALPFNSLQPAEVEAVFTDAAGRFESGSLWPGCVYTILVSADGMAPERLQTVEGQAGKTQEFPPVVLTGTSVAVAGTVVGPDGRPLAGATVISSGDGPKRLTAATDDTGRFSLSGLYDGPAVLVAQKPGYRAGYAVARTGGPPPTIVLRPLTDPPAAVGAFSEEQQRAEAELVRRLTEIVKKGRAGLPPSPAAPADPWAEARKDLDGYLAKQTRHAETSSALPLLPLARVLAKEDQGKARRVLEAAADAARRRTPPKAPGGVLIPGMTANLTAVLRLQELLAVAATAAELDLRAEAESWLTEAEAQVGQLPEAHRQGLLGELAAAWVMLDPARTEKVLAGVRTDAMLWDMAVTRIIERLLRRDPEQACAWLDRFKQPRQEISQAYRAQVAAQLAGRDMARALRLAEGISAPVYRGATFARLATAVHKVDPRGAQGLIDKAAAALATPDPEEYSEDRLGAAVYLLWQAKAVEYADLESLVAVALLSRRPVPAQEGQTQARRSQRLRLAAGVGSLDPVAGRAVLGFEADQVPTRADDEEGAFHEWLPALALTDPAAAVRHLPSDLDLYTAEAVLAVLERRSSVIERLYLVERLWWLRSDSDALTNDD
jgi:hypothetical protein